MRQLYDEPFDKDILSDLADTDATKAPDDDAPEMDSDGYRTLTPDFDAKEMFAALHRQDKDSKDLAIEPKEAQDATDFQNPLDAEEAEILRDSGDWYRRSRWVDEPDSAMLMRKNANGKARAMEAILEDQMYGDRDDYQMRGEGDEWGRLRGWDESGSLFGKIARGVSRGARGALRAAGKAVSSASRVFTPGRDRKKAQLIRRLNKKLVKEHTNWLRMNDAKNGIFKPASAYTAKAKNWSRNQLTKHGLPTSTTSGNQIAHDILGGDCCIGSWYNPFSWFDSKTKFVLVDTEGQRLGEMDQSAYNQYMIDHGQNPGGSQDAQSPDGAPSSAPPQDADADQN